MDLRITDCQATPSSITLVFSTNGTTSIANATFTVFDPSASSAPIQPTSSAITGNVAKLTLSPSSLHVGDQILVSVTGIVLSPAPPEPPTPLAVGAVVKSALQIVNCVATPTLVVVYFSENLNPTPSNVAASPNNSSNYTVQPAGRPLLNPASAVYDDSIQATFLQFGPNVLQWGQELTVTVNNVTDQNGTPIGNSGSNTFYTRIGAHDRDGGGSGDGLTRREIREVTESVEDAVAYPVLTEQVSFPSSTGGAPTTGALTPVPAGAALATTAAKAVTDVLGWKVNSSDPKGFIGALTQAFTLTEVQGHVEATWNPRTYAVQTDIGQGFNITGAQAVLFSRAKNALDQCLPLLDGLYPLDPDADPEYVKALREMARSQMNAIVTELGTVGGPSVLRINTYFGILLGTAQPILFGGPGTTVPQFDPDQIQGTLGELRDTYGIYFQKGSQNNPFSNSIEDEQDITNFRVISDYMTSLLQTWISNGQFFVLGVQNQPAFFGTQLVLISRQFSVIAETVNELRFSLDSVFIGPSERQTLLLQFANNIPPIFLEDMLQQVETFVSNEGPGLLQNGGRISVTNNVLPVMNSFFQMVRGARRPVNLRQLPDGYRTVRVQRALDDLRDQINELINLVQPVGQQLPAAVQVAEPLQVLFVNPRSLSASAGPVATVTVAGTGFDQSAACAFVSQQGAPPISVIGPQLATENLLFAQIRIVPPPSGTTYSYKVSVTNPDGTSNALANALTVTSNGLKA
jgi:hypothetical protein